MARYASGPLKGKEISWWPTQSQVLNRPGTLSAEFINHCIATYSQPGDIILDPFCRSEHLVSQAVQGGRSAIAIHFDPLADLCLRTGLNPPPMQQMDALLTRLADAPKMNTTLREHLQSLYRTSCASCNNPVSADYFLWDRDENIPLRKKYRCASCRGEYEESVSEADIEQAGQVKAGGLYYSYILDRLPPRDDVERDIIDQVMRLYTPRNLYALVQLLLKSEALFSGTALLAVLRWALLSALDASTKLHTLTQTGAVYRPRRLHPPRQFLEINVWLAFEQACEKLKSKAAALSLPLAAETGSLFSQPGQPRPAAPGLVQAYVGRQSVRSLAQGAPPGSLALIIGQPPEFDAVYWPLACLWSGWLYGRQAAEPLWSLTRRRGAAWRWYEKAVQIALQVFNKLLKPRGCMALSLSSAEPPYQGILILAALEAGFRLFAGRLTLDDPTAVTARFSGQPGTSHLFFARARPTAMRPVTQQELANWIREETLNAAVETLIQQGEPLSTTMLESLIWFKLAQREVLHQAASMTLEGGAPFDFVSGQIQQALSEALSQQLVWVTNGRATPADEEKEKGAWWLKSAPEGVRAFDNRVEEAIRDLLQSQPSWTWPTLNNRLQGMFPPPLSPEPQLVQICLAAYARELEPGKWQWLGGLESQQGQKIGLFRSLVRLGNRLGCPVWLAPEQEQLLSKAGELAGELTAGDKLRAAEGLFDAIWLRPDGKRSAFAWCDTSEIDRLLARFPPAIEDEELYLIVPHAKSGLLRYKIRRSVLRRKMLRAGAWRFVKDIHIQSLAQAAEVDWQKWSQVSGLEPLVEQDEAQLPLF